MPVTIEDLSKRLGLSRSTISKALNDRVDVSPQTKARIEKAASELCYQPSAAARNHRRQRTDKIGLVVNYPIHNVADFVAESITGMASAAEFAEGNLILKRPWRARKRVSRTCAGRATWMASSWLGRHG